MNQINVDPNFEQEVKKIAAQMLSEQRVRDRMSEPFETLTVVLGEENLRGAVPLHKFEFEQFPGPVFVIEDQE